MSRNTYHIILLEFPLCIERHIFDNVDIRTTISEWRQRCVIDEYLSLPQYLYKIIR